MQAASEMGWGAAEAERAFGRAVRARRWAVLTCRMMRRCTGRSRLAVFDAHQVRSCTACSGVRDIPVDAIAGSLEPHRAADFDGGFRPAPRARTRWLRVWLAEQRGAVLPPISVAPIGGAYALLDGHHRVSVARARGAVTITAIVT